MGASGVARVELKVTVVGDEVGKAETAFDLGADEPERRRIFFAEGLTGPDEPLPLTARGLILRVRVARRKATATIKLRGPEDCLDPAAWARRASAWGDDAKIEGDRTGRRFTVAASLDHDVRSDDPIADPRTAADVRALLSDDQLGLVEDWMLPLDRLVPVGPVVADSWKRAVEGMPGTLSLERWRVGDDLCFLELSVRVDAGEADAAAARLDALVAAHGLTVDPAAPSKTETVLRRLVSDRLADR